MSLDMPQDNSPYLSDPDVLLMLEFQKGNAASFETLMRKYYASILNFIYRFVGSREAAEDLTQEVFVRVYKSAAAYKPQAKFQTWIYTIAKNISLNELRKNKRKVFSLDAPFRSKNKDDELQRQIADPLAILPDQDMEKKEKQEQVRTAIEALPDNQRIAVLLRKHDEFSYEDISKTMGLSVSAVKSLLSRARENLKGKLEGIIK